MEKKEISFDNKKINIEIVTKQLVTNKFVGNYKSIFRGRGLEFDSYRNYNFNDDSLLIDWKASKKAHKLLVKEFVEERNLNIFFLVDVSSGMLTGSSSKLKFEYIAELIATITYAAVNSRDKISFALFSNELKNERNLNNSKGEVKLIVDYLLDYNNYSGFFSLEKSLDYLINRVKESAVVFIISDFITPVGWETNLLLASKKFDLICVVVKDNLDLSFPNTNMEITLMDPNTKQELVVEPGKIKQAYEEEAEKQLNYLLNQFKESSVDYLYLMTDKNFLEPLIKFFLKRKMKYK